MSIEEEPSARSSYIYEDRRAMYRQFNVLLIVAAVMLGVYSLIQIAQERL